VAHGPKLALRGVTSHLVTDMCMYSHAIVGVSPHDYGRAMVGYICPTHTVSVTYKLGVTAAGMIGHAPSPRPTEGKRPIAAAGRSLSLLLVHMCTLGNFLGLLPGRRAQAPSSQQKGPQGLEPTRRWSWEGKALIGYRPRTDPHLGASEPLAYASHWAQGCGAGCQGVGGTCPANVRLTCGSRATG
jgi:hypothetical protein